MHIRTRAFRRCGELLKEIEKKQGETGNPIKLKKGDVPRFDSTPRQTTAQQAGLSPYQATQSIQLANIPKELFEDQVESESPPTITSLAEQGMAPEMTLPIDRAT